MLNEKNEGFEIDLQKLLGACLNKWWLFVVAAIISGMLSFWYTTCFVTPMYQADVTVYVNNIRRGEDITYLSGTNLLAAQQLVATYIQIIGSDAVLGKVADVAGLDIEAKDIRGMMSTRQMGETELFKFSIVHPDPVQAEKIANAIAEVAPAEIESFVAGTSAKIVDYAAVPENPVSPSAFKNCVLGMAMGIMLIFAYVLIQFLLDVRIKAEEDLASLFSFPVLGQIPVFATDNTKYKGRHQKKGGAKK